MLLFFKNNSSTYLKSLRYLVTNVLFSVYLLVCHLKDIFHLQPFFPEVPSDFCAYFVLPDSLFIVLDLI